MRKHELVPNTVYSQLVSEVIREATAQVLPSIEARRKQYKETYGKYARTPEEEAKYRDEHPGSENSMTFGELNVKFASMGMPSMGVPNYMGASSTQIPPAALECVQTGDLKQVGDIADRTVRAANYQLGLPDSKRSELAYQVYSDAVKTMFPATWADDEEFTKAFDCKDRRLTAAIIALIALEYLLAAYRYLVNGLVNTPFLLGFTATATLVGMLYAHYEMSKAKITDAVHERKYWSFGRLAPSLAGIIVNGFVLVVGIIFGWA